MAGLPASGTRVRRGLAAHAVRFCGLGAYVLLVYVVVVLGGGALIGRTSSPDLTLSVLATVIVAVSFGWVESWLDRVTHQALHGGTASAYDVMGRFSRTVSGSFPAEELTARMAKVLADGTGAAWAQVWLVVDGSLRPAATWPTDAAPASAEPTRESAGRRSLPVVQAGEELGALVLQERSGVPLTSVEERLFAGLAGQAGLALRGARLRAELTHRVEQLSTRADELRSSRQRVVDVQDSERRRLERDIHDGAQQHLVALAVNLRLAHTLAGRSPDRAAKLVGEQAVAAEEAVQTLVRLSRGIYPSRLTEEGLEAALGDAAEQCPVPTTLVVDGVGRLPESQEAALYFCCLEALQNAAKHAAAQQIRVELGLTATAVTATVDDDGTGVDLTAVSAGRGLANMRDRLASVGGTLTIGRSPAGGTRVAARVPATFADGRRAG